MHYRGINQEAMTVQAQYAEWLRRLQESRVAKLERRARETAREEQAAAEEEGSDADEPAGDDSEPPPEQEPERFQASA